jgi:arylsulfatase A-like enzyme
MPILSRRAMLASAAAPFVLPAAGQRRNVLFIAVDDLNTRLGCYGAPVKSPSIDALAKSGVRFERAYCQYPLCNPTRSSLLTGRRPPTTKIFENATWFRDTLPDVVTLPQHFKENGYVTAQTGKIFHGGLDDDRGWTIGGTPLRRAVPRTPEQQKEREKTADRWLAVDGEGESQPDYRTATRAIELLGQLKDKPFFLAVGFVKPHVPFIAPKKYFDLYDPARIALPADFAPEPISTEPAYRPNFDVFIKRRATPELARQAIAAYYASISFMDAQLGRVMHELDRLKLRDSTVIVFFGDHGWHLGEKGMWSKQSVFEPAARVPMVISVPGAKGNGKTSPRTVEFVDLYPTLVEACGLPKAAGLEGGSLVGLTQDPNARWDHPAYTYQRRGAVMGASVRTERHRFTEWDEGRRGTELYEYASDPREEKNLAADPKYAATVSTLRELLRHPKVG